MKKSENDGDKCKERRENTGMNKVVVIVQWHLQSLPANYSRHSFFFLLSTLFSMALRVYPGESFLFDTHGESITMREDSKEEINRGVREVLCLCSRFSCIFFFLVRRHIGAGSESKDRLN